MYFIHSVIHVCIHAWPDHQVILCLQIARSINPSLHIGPMSRPCVLAPLLAAAQEANVCEAKDAPNPCQLVPEDLRLLDPCMADGKGVTPVPVTMYDLLTALSSGCVQVCTRELAPLGALQGRCQRYNLTLGPISFRGDNRPLF